VRQQDSLVSAGMTSQGATSGRADVSGNQLEARTAPDVLFLELGVEVEKGGGAELRNAGFRLPGTRPTSSVVNSS